MHVDWIDGDGKREELWLRNRMHDSGSLQLAWRKRRQRQQVCLPWRKTEDRRSAAKENFIAQHAPVIAETGAFEEGCIDGPICRGGDASEAHERGCDKNDSWARGDAK